MPVHLIRLANGKKVTMTKLSLAVVVLSLLAFVCGVTAIAYSGWRASRRSRGGSK